MKFVNDGCRISKNTVYQILFDLKEDLSFTYIAKKNNVNVQTVINIFEKYVPIEKHSLSETICIDEFKNLKSAKGKYAFLIYDPINKKIIEVLESRKSDDINRYFYSLGFEERSKVRYVVSDMNEVYRSLVKKYFPKATYIVDGFHYLRYVEDAFNKVRIRTQKMYSEKSAEYKMLKRHWKILSHYYIDLGDIEPYNYLRKCKDSKERVISDTVCLTDELFEAYNILQDFLYYMKNIKYENAREMMDKWIKRIYSSNIKEFNDLCAMFSNWKEEIINSFIRFGDSRLSNGPIEGMNNHIKEIKRIAFGYRNFSHFRKRIMYIVNKEKPIKI